MRPHIGADGLPISGFVSKPVGPVSFSLATSAAVGLPAEAHLLSVGDPTRHRRLGPFSDCARSTLPSTTGVGNSIAIAQPIFKMYRGLVLAFGDTS